MDDRIKKALGRFRGNRRKALEARGALAPRQVLSDVDLVFADAALMDGVEVPPEELIAALDHDRIVHSRRAAMVERWALKALATAMTGHEINSSLHHLEGIVSRASEKLPDNRELGSAKDIVERFRNTMHFVNRVASGHNYRDEGRAGDALELVDREFSRLISRGLLKIEKTEAFDTVEMYFNKLTLGFVLVNLVRNSVYWANAGRDREVQTVVRLDIEERSYANRDGEIETDHVLRVEDNGPGIAQEHRSKLFEPEFSGRRSSGIGLYLCRSNLEAAYHTIVLDDRPSALGGAAFLIGRKSVLEGYEDRERALPDLAIVMDSLAGMVEEGNVTELHKWSDVYEEACGLAMHIRLGGGPSTPREELLVSAMDRISDVLRGQGRSRLPDVE